MIRRRSSPTLFPYTTLFRSALYRSLGGSGASLALAVLYSNILFGGAISFWILLLLQAALRGTGDVKVPAMTILGGAVVGLILDRKSTRLNSSHSSISYAVFC